MIIDNKYGKVDFSIDFDKYKKVGINLSGGCDSSLMLYFLCKVILKYNNFIKIIPITGVDLKRPTNILNVESILDFMNEVFPTIIFENHEVNYYTKDHEKDKINKHKEYENKLFDKNKIDLLLHGRTSNPPKEEALKNDLFYNREEIRDISEKELWFKDKYFMPFNNVDKRFIAECYKKENLIKKLFPLTTSCVAYKEETNFFTQPCKKCWWCKEKKWAFGMYDGCVQ